MKVEVVTVGTELLLGQIVNTNASWLGEQLALAGMDCTEQQTVGDNLERIVEAVELGLRRADVVITCGGLGPTQDDITRDALARVMGTSLVTDDDVADRILEMFVSRGRRMPANNMRQAQVPVGAQAIADPQPGTAPGLVCPVGDKVVYAVPGVPREMEAIVTKAILPDLRERAGVPAVILSRTLRTWGESESGLAERLSGLIDELDELAAAGGSSVTLAFLASGPEGLKVRLTAKTEDEEDANRALDFYDERVRNELGSRVFGIDGATMESTIGELLLERGLTLAVAESVTGGLVASRLVAAPGASGWFRGGVVSYATEVKQNVLSVPPGPVVSGDAAVAMASGVRELLGADIGLAVTGVAGPEPQEGQEPGTVFLARSGGPGVPTAVAGDDATLVRLPGNREGVRQLACISLLDMLRYALLA